MQALDKLASCVNSSTKVMQQIAASREVKTSSNEPSENDKDWMLCKMLYSSMKEIPEGFDKEDLRIDLQKRVNETKRMIMGYPTSSSSSSSHCSTPFRQYNMQENVNAQIGYCNQQQMFVQPGQSQSSAMPLLRSGQNMQATVPQYAQEQQPLSASDFCRPTQQATQYVYPQAQQAINNLQSASVLQQPLSVSQTHAQQQVVYMANTQTNNCQPQVMSETAYGVHSLGDGDTVDALAKASYHIL
jgi:hypothetical protein